MDNVDSWSDEDKRLTDAARLRHFPNGASWIRADDVDTGRDWGGWDKGLSTGDSRIPIKNNAEYHGMERHAWQYLAAAMYPEARDYFYCAAAVRREDSEEAIVGPIDDGHDKAILICLRMARFSQAVGTYGWNAVAAEDYGLDSDWVVRRVDAAEQLLEGP